jgi:hypothetical protein
VGASCRLTVPPRSRGMIRAVIPGAWEQKFSEATTDPLPAKGDERGLVKTTGVGVLSGTGPIRCPPFGH